MAYDMFNYGGYLNNLFGQPQTGQSGAMAFPQLGAGAGGMPISSDAYYNGLLTGQPVKTPSMAAMETAGVGSSGGLGNGDPMPGMGYGEPPGTWSNPDDTPPPQYPPEEPPGTFPPPKPGGENEYDFKNFRKFFKHFFGDGQGSMGAYYSGKRGGPGEYLNADVPDEWRNRAYRRINKPGGPNSPYPTPGENWGGWKAKLFPQETGGTGFPGAGGYPGR